jgi:hypothetical protein
VTEDQITGGGASASCLFAVRIWKEQVAGGREYRANVRQVVGGAFRGFRDWSDLVAFMVQSVEEVEVSGERRPEPSR